MNKNKTIYGFTLAETLITLVIVGVVAALTVPNLIMKYHKEQTVTQFKKAYSALAQVAAKAIADNGPVTSWEGNSITFANQYLKPYLSISKDITETTYKFKTITNNEKVFDSSKAKFYLNDGTLVAVDGKFNSDGCVYYRIMVDINGDKKPNTVGRDIFVVQFDIAGYNVFAQGKFIPAGIQKDRSSLISNTSHGCKKSGNTTGYYCGALIMKDNWTIADDYPW